MPPRWLRSRADVPDWDDVRAHVVAAAALYDSTVFTIAAPDREPAVSWTDGPAGETFAEAIGDLPGWTLVAGDPGGDVTPSGPVLFVRRDLSDQATAVAVVRFYGAQGRHWSAAEGPAGREAWVALTATDDPATSGYPIADMVARLLLEAPEPGGIPAVGSRAEILAAKLAAIGYEKLWAVAFSAAR